MGQGGGRSVSSIARSPAHHNNRNPGHRLFLNGTDRQIAKNFWAERERYKDQIRREEWSECTFAPELSPKVALMERPKELAPECRFKAEEQRRRLKLEAARREKILEEIAACTFQPLTLRAASLSPYAPTRVGGVHEALYRVAQVKRKWAKDLQPHVLDQLIERQRIAQADTGTDVPKMSREEMRALIDRLVNPEMYDEACAEEGDVGAVRRVRSRSRSPQESVRGHQHVDPQPYINPRSEELAAQRAERQGQPADVVDRLVPDPQKVAEAEAAKARLAEGSYRPTITQGSAAIVATSRERHLRELFARLWVQAEALKRAIAQDEADAAAAARGEQTEVPPAPQERPPLAPPRSASAPTSELPTPDEVPADATLGLEELCIAARGELSVQDCNDLLDVLSRFPDTVYDGSTFATLLAQHANRYGAKPFMRPSRATRASTQQRAMARIAREVHAEKRYPGIPTRADIQPKGWIPPWERREKLRPETSARMRQIREFADHEAMAECTFQPKLNLSNFVFVRSESGNRGTPSSARGGVSRSQSADASGHHPHPKGQSRRRVDAQLDMGDAADDGVSAARGAAQRGPESRREEVAAARQRQHTRNGSVPPGFDPTRVQARTVMRDEDVYRGSVTEEYAEGGDGALRDLGQRMMQEQLLRLGSTRRLAHSDGPAGGASPRR
jgi:hypothetical protein